MDNQLDDKRLFPALERLSLVELQELIRKDAYMSDKLDMNYINAVLAVIKKREAESPDFEPIDLDAGWNDFVDNYVGKESEYLHLAPSFDTDDKSPVAPVSDRGRRSRRVWRWVARVAVLAVFLGMLTAQVFGYNVVETVARWTADVFRFEAPVDDGIPAFPAEVEISPDMQFESLQEVLDVIGVTLLAVPTWYPDGFVQTELIATQLPSYIIITAVFEKEERLFTVGITVDIYSNHNRYHEKDDTDVVIYEVAGIRHYIMSNYYRMAAVWLNGNLEVSIQGDITEADLRRMIDSVYGG